VNKKPVIPKSIKIGGKTYKVRFFNRDELRKNLFGQIGLDAQEIRIDDSLHQEKVEQTITHEIIHGCEHALGKDFNEETVTALGELLYQVLMDNNPWWGN